MAIAAHNRRCMALRQLETALSLYFEKEDYYSVITLSGAADEIFGQLLKAEKKENSLENINKSVAEIYKSLTGEDFDPKEIAKRANRARNSLKHWSPGQPLVVEFDAREEAQDMLNRAIDNYWQLESSLSPAMERFQREFIVAS
ncbi:hypothetical protein Q2E61_06815 [Microbulbifer thermotolerans]|uniref:hypothetical protein n=1 Tax=Microbulbifer thermotolerans TaxID=252514 RepID=UPI002671586E|nr:hypothetical protein [Microbulbifer thermotolerans]WKT61902.1 hypothetical protein Q2E61_06815 [Microbulbifer thermotolerans]